MPDQVEDPNEWIRYAGVDKRHERWLRRQQRRRRGGHSGPPLFLAVCLIAAGILLFLNSVGILSIPNVWHFWPLIPICAGVGRLVEYSNPIERVIAILLIIFGGVAFFFTFGLLHVRNGSWIFAIVLLFMGSVALVKALEARVVPPPVGFTPPIATTGAVTLNDSTVMGGVKRRVETDDFCGGTIDNFMGAVEIDLRRAQISPARKTATIEIRAIASGVKLRIPESWRLNVAGAGILGTFEDKTAPPNTGADAPVLVVTGYSAFSAVEIEN